MTKKNLKPRVRAERFGADQEKFRLRNNGTNHNGGHFS